MASHVPGSGVRMIHPLETARMQTRTIAPKPLHRPAKLPARKPNRMTIAIGMLCEGGLAIAADTQATNADGTTYDRAKVKAQKTAKGLFAAAFSGEDLNATEMLINDLLIDLNLLDPQSIFGVEDAIRNRMLQWSAIFQAKDERLYTGFVLGARVAGNSVNPSKLALYFCEPPGKVFRQTMEDTKGYVAVGAGCVVTDPLFRTLFGQSVSPRVCLGQLSYLMYRAKKDCRGACGGGTDAVLIMEDHEDPLWIEQPLMKQAEFR